MTEDKPSSSVRPQFKNFPRLRAAQEILKATPSIYDNKDSSYNKYIKQAQIYKQTHSPTEAHPYKKQGRLTLWINRNPRTFQIIVITVGLSVLFSRPLYDLFFGQRIDLEQAAVMLGIENFKKR